MRTGAGSERPDEGTDRALLPDDERFRFAGRHLEELAALAGQTPAYVYDRHAIERRVERLREDLPPSLKVHYSLKANPLPALVGHVAGLVDGLDVASHAELRTALGSGADPARTSFSGPGKRDAELLAAVTAGVTVHLESPAELDRLTDVAADAGRAPRLSVRVNPDFSVRRSGMVMGGGPQPFGVDRERVPALIERIRERGLECTGLHCYAGSQMLSADVVADAQARTLDMLAGLVREAALGRVALNIGGGFGIPYFAGESPLELRRVGDALARRIDALRADVDASEIALELGRYLVGEAGIYLARVTERKTSRGSRFLVLDGGLNHHLAASGNLGQVVRRDYPIVGSRAVSDVGPEKTSVVGPLCTPLDVLADGVRLPRLGAGEYVAVLQSGAYGFSASPHGFLGHPPPVELLI